MAQAESGSSRMDLEGNTKAFILAHKLVAGREKDMDDIRALLDALNISTRKQAQNVIDRYITNKDIQQPHRLQKVLDAFPRLK